MQVTDDKPKFTEFNIEPNHMLRYEVNDSMTIVLKSGKAEIFGRELVIDAELPLDIGHRGTLITFHGCKIEIHAENPTAFILPISEDQDIPFIYINIHANLEKLRSEALKKSERGPRVLVVGYDSVGKTTLCKTLLNYASRKGHHPMYVETNVGMNEICVPATMAALAVSKPFDLREKWLLEEDPLVYSFGYTDPCENLNLYREQVSKLADMINIRSENDSKIFSSGCIINMAGFKKDDITTSVGNQKSIHAVRATATSFEVDVVIVIEDGFLCEFLKSDFPSEITVIRVPKSSGVITRTQDQLIRQRDARICSYFHGESSQRRFHPHQFILPISEFEVYKVGSEAVPDALLPQGAEKEETWRKTILVPITKELKNKVLAVSQSCEPDGIPFSPIYGLVVIVDVHLDRKTFTVLSPSPNRIPNNYLVLTSLSYVDPENLQ